MKKKDVQPKKKKYSYKYQKEREERILNDKTDFDTIETFKAMRTNIMFSMPKTEGGKAIAITSPSPGEGKTTTSINLAITFAQLGAKVLLLDCDLRKPRVHRYLKLDRKNGVTNVLCGFSDFDKAVHRDVKENLDCLTSGEIPLNPAELLGTEEFVNLLAELKEKYDYIFIDTPPITLVTDAALIMEHCTGTAVVVRQDVTRYDMLDATMEVIQKIGVKVLGFVILGSAENMKKYNYYRRRNYNYKYGYKNSFKYGYIASKSDYKYGDDVSEKK